MKYVKRERESGVECKMRRGVDGKRWRKERKREERGGRGRKREGDQISPLAVFMKRTTVIPYLVEKEGIEDYLSLRVLLFGGEGRENQVVGSVNRPPFLSSVPSKKGRL